MPKSCFDYPYTCQYIDKVANELASFIFEEFNVGDFTPTQEKHFNSLIDKFRNINSAMRDEAEVQIRDLQDAVASLEEDVKVLESQIRDLKEVIEDKNGTIEKLAETIEGLEDDICYWRELE